MADAYQPFLIANLRYGLELGLQPWLLPAEAFTQINNAYLSNGVLSKRKGYTPFGRLVHALANEVIGTGNGTNKTFTGTLAHHPLRPGDLAITDGVEPFTDNGAGVLTGSAGGTGAIAYDTGVFSVTFHTAPGLNVQVKASYNYFPNLPCMGIFNYATSGGSQDLIAWTTKRANRYNEVTSRFEDISLADQFTGYDYDFFWLANWLNLGFMTNGKDRIKYWNSTALTDLTIDLSVPPDGTNDLNTAYLIIPYKDRLLFLRTTEGGTLFAQRARWTNVNQYNASDPTNYVDATTSEWIVGACFVGNELVVFFERSVWLLRYTGDSRLPFRWVRVAANDGLIAKMGLMDFANEAIGLGPTRLIGTDATEVYNLDDKIPNLVLTMNQAALQYCYATAVDELNQLWISYTSLGASLPDQVIVLNYDEKCFFTFQLPHMVTGYYQEQADLTWDEIDQSWNEIEWAWDDRTLQAGYPVTLGGDYQGYIWKMNRGGDDNGAAIAMSITGGRWNPFVKAGKRCRLGWVDFLVDRDPLCQLTVEYCIDHETAAWQSEVITLDDGSENDKIWVRSYVGAEANFHQLRLSNNAVNQTIVIHAIMPWCCEGGLLN